MNPIKSLLPLRRPLAIALASGLAMGLTPAPAHLWFLAWVALAPLWVLVHPCSPLGLKPKLLLCLVWGLGYHGLALSWIRDLHPLTWMGIPWLSSVAIALFAWGFITLWGAGIPITWCLGWHWGQRFWPAKRLSSLIFPIALWCVLETFWSHGPLYWTALSYTQSPHNLLILHLGRLSGPMAVTAALVAVNGLLAEAWIAWQQNTVQRGRRLLGLTAALLLGLHLVGFVLYSQPLADAPEQALKVGIVQGNIPTRIKLFEEGQRLALRRYTQGYVALVQAGADAVLMPEGALPWRWVSMPPSQQQQDTLHQAIRRLGVPVWVGTVGDRPGGITQSLFTLTGNGQVYSQYDKIKLVPLGEYIPFAGFFGRFINRLSPIDTSMIPGRPDQVFETPFGRAIAGICYESAFPHSFRFQAEAGGQFILTGSNNDPYGRAMMAQHHAQDLMRAVETDRWAVRATNTGLSGIVDPHGRTQWLSGFRTTETHLHTIYRRQTQTPYVRWGDWLTPALVLAVVLVGVGKPGQGRRDVD